MAAKPHIIISNNLSPGSVWAHDVNTINMAYGFAQNNCRVTLVTIASKNGPLSRSKLEKLYGRQENLRWIQLGRHWCSKYILSKHDYVFFFFAKTLLKKMHPDGVYSRDYHMPLYSAKLGIPTIVESHADPDKIDAKLERIFRKLSDYESLSLVTISDYLKEKYSEKGVPLNKISIHPDAVNEVMFTRKDKFNQPFEKMSEYRANITYAGHLYAYKGVETILLTAKNMPQYMFHFIGGWDEDIRRVNARVIELDIKNVVLHGRKPHSEVPPYLWASDVLLLPPSLNHPSAKWTSPMKLGEYMLSGTPVVASSIPALKKLVTDAEVYFFSPDSSSSLENAICDVLSDGSRAARKGQKAIEKALKWTFKSRANKFLTIMGLDRARV